MTVGAAWQDRVIERSVERIGTSPGDRGTRGSMARRALRPAIRIVQAAMDLSHEGDSTSFTVQEVTGRADVALQTFYRHFASKDDLILAVIEEEVATSAETYRKRVDRLDDPVAKVETVVKGPFRRKDSSSLTITREHLRLLDTHPMGVWAADAPYRELLAETIRMAQDGGRFHGVDADEESDMITTLVLSRYHNLVLGAVRHTLAEEAAHIWSFCLAALSREAPTNFSPK